VCVETGDSSEDNDNGEHGEESGRGRVYSTNSGVFIGDLEAEKKR